MRRSIVRILYEYSHDLIANENPHHLDYLLL